MAVKHIKTIDAIEIEEILSKYLHVFDCTLKNHRHQKWTICCSRGL